MDPGRRALRGHREHLRPAAPLQIVAEESRKGARQGRTKVRLTRPGRAFVRLARPGDAVFAREAARLIAAAARGHDIARRSTAMLRGKIETGRAVIARSGDELVGFGYFAEWEGGAFLSHSGLVVRPDFRGTGLGRRLKVRLIEASRKRFPEAATISLTTSPSVHAINHSLGFRDVPISRLTKDPAFWKGCVTCRNYEEIRAAGKRCCCGAMLLEPIGSGRAKRRKRSR